jgi:hypothetical protein
VARGPTRRLCPVAVSLLLLVCLSRFEPAQIQTRQYQCTNASTVMFDHTSLLPVTQQKYVKDLSSPNRTPTRFRWRSTSKRQIVLALSLSHNAHLHTQISKLRLEPRSLHSPLGRKSCKIIARLGCKPGYFIRHALHSMALYFSAAEQQGNNIRYPISHVVTCKYLNEKI